MIKYCNVWNEIGDVLMLPIDEDMASSLGCGDGGDKVLKPVKLRGKASAGLSKKLEVRRKRLERLQVIVGEQENKVAKWSGEVDRFEAKGFKGDGAVRAVFLKTAAIKKLSDLKDQIEKTNTEIAKFEASYSGLVGKPDDNQIGELQESGNLFAYSDVPRDGDPDLSILDRARDWGAKHGIDGFVETVDLEDGPVEVIRLHRARYAKVEPTIGVWPALFSIENSTKEETAARRLRMDALLATAGPDMQRMVGILSTPGMLHAVVVEALTLRGRVLPVSTDPEVLRKGRDALADFKVLDASVYEKAMKE